MAVFGKTISLAGNSHAFFTYLFRLSKKSANLIKIQYKNNTRKTMYLLDLKKDPVRRRHEALMMLLKYTTSRGEFTTYSRGFFLHMQRVNHFATSENSGKPGTG